MNTKLLKQIVLDESMPLEMKEMALNLLINEQPKNCTCSIDSLCSVDSFGNKFWKNKDGQFHRVNGPAVEYKDGSKRWFLNGKCHRIDGPAAVDADGSQFWYLNGTYIPTEEEFKNALQRLEFINSND